jgi:anti-sigma B factor antagonist
MYFLRRRRPEGDDIMAYTVEHIGDVCVLALEGDVWGGWDTVDIKTTVGRLLDQGRRNFLIDLSRTNYVNSVGIGILVAILVTSTRTEARLALCSVSPRTQRALEVTRIGELFRSFRDRDEGIRALAGAGGPPAVAGLNSRGG